MNRLSLPILTAVASALVLSPLVASAQANSLDANQSSIAAPALIASLDLPAGSSSSSSSAFDSSVASTVAPPPTATGGSTRPFSSVGVGVKIGIGGIGFDVATPLVPGVLNVRGGAGFFSYTYNGTVDNEPVNAKLKLNNAEVMVDVFPFKGSFRLSAGTTVYNTTGLNGTVTVAPGSQITIGNDSYTSSTSSPLNGTVAAGFGGKAVPRFSLGWGNLVAKNHHIRFESELGVEIIGTPTVAWTYGGSACYNTSSCPTGTPINSIPGATADIAAQTAKFQNDLNGLKVFPIFSIGLSYKIGH